METIKLRINKILAIFDVSLSRIDRSEYTFRDDLHIKAIVAAKEPRGKRILDIGSARDSWTKEKFGKDNEVISFDLEGDVDVKGSILSAPFEDKSFDLVFFFETLEHVDNPFLAIQEIRRILKPKGMLVASAPFIYELHGEDYGDYWRITRQGWQKLLKEFKDIEVSSMGRHELKPHHYFIKAIK